GSAVARHLLEAGHEVAVYNRTKAKADPLVTEGAIWADTPKAVSKMIFFSQIYLRDLPKLLLGSVDAVSFLVYSLSLFLSIICKV
ncbi:NAD(P)-binding domain-containing protein, partial [Enterococcus faecium]|uniref:NAD(P)-binding domain-containing protein n=1 Tax=Enterococcus faecium TaxID=1352 RepID=UPI00292DDB22